LAKIDLRHFRYVQECSQLKSQGLLVRSASRNGRDYKDDDTMSWDHGAKEGDIALELVI